MLLKAPLVEASTGPVISLRPVARSLTSIPLPMVGKARLIMALLLICGLARLKMALLRTCFVSDAETAAERASKKTIPEKRTVAVKYIMLAVMLQ